MAIVRFLIGGLGALAATVGIILIAVAVGLMSWLGPDETVELPEIHVTAVDGRVVARDLDFLWDEPRFAPDLGSVDLRLRAADGGPIFAGIAHAGDLDDDDLIRGVASEDDAVFVVSDSGSVARVRWEVEPGEWSLLVVADEGDEIVIDGEITAAEFRLAAVTVGGIGIAAAVAGGLMLIVALTSGRRRNVPERTVTADREPAGV